MATEDHSPVINALKHVRTPAHVNRYMEPARLGWRPFFDSWLNTLPDPLRNDSTTDHLRAMFEWLIEPLSVFLRDNTKDFVDTSQVCALPQH